MTSPVYEGRDLEVLSDMPNYYGWILDEFLPYLGGVCAEFGAGTGNVSVKIRQHVNSLTLVEPSDNLLEGLARRFVGDTDCRIVNATLESAIEEMAPATLDSIVMVNVLEHIEDDRAAVHKLYELLRPSGRLMIFVPAMQVLYSPFDADVGHFRRYYKAELLEIVTAAGFQISKVTYFDIVGFFGWWVVMKVLRSRGLDPKAAKSFDRYVVPLVRRLEALVPVPFGKNLLLCASKQGISP